MARFEVRLIGTPRWFLGMRIIRDMAKGTLSICQDTYIDKLIHLPFGRVYRNNTTDPSTTRRTTAIRRNSKPGINTVLPDQNRLSHLPSGLYNG